MTDPRPTSDAELIEQIRSIDVRAPESLHRQVEAMIAGKAPAPTAASAYGGSRRAALRRGDRRGRAFGFAPRLAAAGAFAAVAIALAIVVGLSGESSVTPRARRRQRARPTAASWRRPSTASPFPIGARTSAGARPVRAATASTAARSQRSSTPIAVASASATRSSPAPPRRR
jgi:hypothetical protein